MKYEISFTDTEDNNIMICELTAIPRVNEIVYFPHFGGYVVKNVVYCISDDCPDNSLTYVSIILDKIKHSNYN